MIKTNIKLLLEGNDITQNLEGLLTSLTYEDKLSGEADTLECVLMDKNHRLLGKDFPPRGSSLRAFIDGLDLGSFEIDDVDYSSPPSVLKVKAVSISQNSGLRQVEESKAWENVLLSKIAQDIADASSVKLFYQTDYDPTINRAEQGEQSRLAFLEKLCSDHGLIVKVSDDTLIVCEEDSLEAQEPVTTLTWQDITRIDAKATLNEVYKDCQVNYKDGKQDKLFSAQATDPTKSEGRTLKINRRVNSQAEAERLARHELRKKNKQEFTVTLTMPLNVQLIAGTVVTLEDFGVFDGKWLIDKSRHSTGNSSVTRIELHKAGDSS